MLEITAKLKPNLLVCTVFSFSKKTKVFYSRHNKRIMHTTFQNSNLYTLLKMVDPVSGASSFLSTQ